MLCAEARKIEVGSVNSLRRDHKHTSEDTGKQVIAVRPLTRHVTAVALIVRWEMREEGEEKHVEVTLKDL